MQPCSAVNPAGLAVAGGAGVAAVGPPVPLPGPGLAGAVGAVGAVVVVVVVLGGTLVVVVVVALGAVVDVVVVGGTTAGAAEATGSVVVVVVVVVAGAVGAGGAVVAVVVVVVVVVTPGVDVEPSGAAVSVAPVHAPAVCMVATSATSLDKELVCAAPSAFNFTSACAAARDASCTWSRAAWYAAVATWSRVTRSDAAMTSYWCATTPSALGGPNGLGDDRPVGSEVLT
jgi:hypothetical protein